MGKVDLLVAWAKRVAKGKDLTMADRVILSALAVAATAYFVRGALAGRSNVPVLKPNDTEKLKTVFFSGEPWMVECSASGKPSPAFFEVEKLMVEAPSDVNLGLLDCGATLPSGKTTLERFKLNAPTAGPTVLLFANQEARPAMATASIVASGGSLLRWAKTTSQPKVNKPTSTETLDKHCLKKKWCVLVFTAVDRPSDMERSSLSKLARAMRDVKFVTVDSAKYTMRLELPDPSASPDAESAEPLNLMPTKSRSAVLLLKPTTSKEEGGSEVKGSAALALAIPSDPSAKQALDDGLKDAPAAITAIRNVINAAEADGSEVPAGFTQLAETPTMRVRRSHRRRANNPPSSSRGSSRTLTDAELKEMRESKARLEKERAEKERERREAMSQEAEESNNIVEEVIEGEEDGLYEDDEGEDDEGGEGEDEEEVEAMELDD